MQGDRIIKRRQHRRQHVLDRNGRQLRNSIGDRIADQERDIVEVNTLAIPWAIPPVEKPLDMKSDRLINRRCQMRQHIVDGDG